jgi:uncharacterized protein
MKTSFFHGWLTRAETGAQHATVKSSIAIPADPESQYNLGQQLAGGEDGGQDPVQAAECFRKAAVQGHCSAQFQLGLMYAQGKGVLRKEATALLWLRKAAELGHAGAQYHVGVKLHRASKGLQQEQASQNRIEAFKFLQLAVTQQHKDAKDALELVALGMTQQEVDEAERRAFAFAHEQSTVRSRPVASSTP